MESTIAGIFRDYVLENLERFESNHLLILHRIIIHQKFNESEAEDWLNLYNDLKKYLFVALCEKQFSGIALSNLIKFLVLLKYFILLYNTFDLFITTVIFINILYKNILSIFSLFDSNCLKIEKKLINFKILFT